MRLPLIVDLSFKETWAFEGELEMYIFFPEKDVSDLMASASSPYYKNQIIKTNYLETTIFYKIKLVLKEHKIGKNRIPKNIISSCLLFDCIKKQEFIFRSF